MLKIENLLDRQELARVVELAAATEFESGAKSAGYRAVRIKDNLEMNAESDAANEIGIIVLNAVERNTDIAREVIPVKAAALSCGHGLRRASRRAVLQGASHTARCVNDAVSIGGRRL